MSKVIRISMELYKRLSAHSDGFETPADVIDKLLVFYDYELGEGTRPTPMDAVKTPTSLEIVYYPDNNIDRFKEDLLKTKRAFVGLYKTDGAIEIKEWNATKISVDSDINSNLRSGYLRGWKDKCIMRAEVSTKKSDLTSIF